MSNAHTSLRLVVLMSFVLATAILGVAVVQASPALALSARQSITPLTTPQIDTFTPYTYYASAGYCTPTETLAWDCGSRPIQCIVHEHFVEC